MADKLKKCLVTYNYGSDEIKKMEELGYEIIVKKEHKLNYDTELEDVEVLVCYDPFESLDILKMKRLKWIQLSSIGIDQLPKDKVIENNIIVTNNRGGYSIPMGEWVVLSILQIYKKQMDMLKNRLDKTWKMDTSLLEFYGKTVGFVGTGSIAMEAAKRLQGFGVRVVGMNTKGKEVDYFDSCYKREAIDEMLAISDIVVIAIPETKETYHLLNKERFLIMKDNAAIVNIARGSIIDEDALIEELQKGRFIGAALDVFKEEPLPKESLLWDIERVLITPHNSWVSEKRNTRRFETVYDNLKRYSKGENLSNVVNVKRGY
ncbi:phosphoglycerate dehydrogenase [Clostridium algidicarnis]|uniref:phosphoglycerate dehydrogenase n=1 Tax=Clostridium algidicarnis TaxID=37659 RepID=UPI00162A18AB|nr:phosphoglycerate dehydrogenase [Clostridium algidicarnis]MBB6697016.1 phosphoglycerate dehydrogenase [Clostridium algidicarnis]MCB2287963.1 phosphoglycerate dehydrogenase [Clostridium algidicarnis]